MPSSVCICVLKNYALCVCKKSSAGAFGECADAKWGGWVHGWVRTTHAELITSIGTHFLHTAAFAVVKVQNFDIDFCNGLALRVDQISTQFI